jgi:hypothetical protein
MKPHPNSSSLNPPSNPLPCLHPMKPCEPVQVKIATLEERLRESAAMPLEDKLAALKKQHGYKQPGDPDPIQASLDYRKSMQKDLNRD